MNNYNKDKILNAIRCEINKSKKNVLEQYNELDEIKNTNIFLKGVYDDYKNYHNYVNNIKKEQEIQILRLLHYLEKNLLEANLTDRMTREALHEQKILLKKLESVRDDMKNVTDHLTD